ncbi:MAG: YafY family transcriptional regulator, partial [Deltaproteobacteria bacterium]|nr:YafY family transcriptional regulator [Deltaproteobacteria bacterium]
RRGMTAVEIAAELDVQPRTVYRDLEALQEAGFPLYADKSEKSSYWKIMEGFKTSFPLPFTTTELMSLHMSRDILKVFEGTVFQQSIESLFAKVKASLPSETLRFLNNISGRLGVGQGHKKDFSAFKHVIAQLSEATARRKRVEITYRALSTGSETKRRVDPYQVWAMNGCFYLIGRCHLRDAVRTFAMDRIKELDVLDDTFHLPADFSLEEYLQTAFRVMTGKPELVRVWFRSTAAQVVKERIWHPTQEIREQEDGSLIVSLEVPINYEIISWILGFGSAATALEPASLRDRIREELNVSLRAYQSDVRVKKKVFRGEKIHGRVS